MNPLPISSATGLSARSDRGIAFALTALWTVATLAVYHGHWAEDLAALFMAGHLWASGQTSLIYAAPDTFLGGTAPEWLPEVARLDMTGRTFFPYVYPPLWAVLLAPLADAFGPEGFNTVFTLIQVPLLAACVWLAGGIARPVSMPRWLWTAIGLGILTVTVIGRSALYFMQPSITAAFLTLLAFERLGKGAPLTAGAALAVATALKISPLVFAFALLIDRQGRALSSFVLSLLFLAAASFCLAGTALHLDFLAVLKQASSPTYVTPGNVALNAALLSAGGVVGLWPAIDLRAEHLVVWGVPAPIAMVRLGGLAFTLAFLASAKGPRARPFVLISLGLGIALFGPIGWLHYLIVPALLAPAFLHAARSRLVPIVLGAAALTFLTPVYRLFTTLPWPTVSYQWLTACICIAALIAALRRARHLRTTSR